MKKSTYIALSRAVVVFALILTGCAAMKSTKITSAQKERLEIIKDNLLRLSTDLLDLQTEYNYHLEDFHHVKKHEESRYRVLYLSDEVFKRADKPASSYKKLEDLEDWTTYLFSFSKTYQKVYARHIKDFHDVVPKTVEGEYIPPEDTISLEERIQVLESNIIRLSNLTPKLQQIYETHMETLYHP
ncbi:hypothetical protein GF359_02780 [candidate division WOR-3 bacterium]|uniref:Uncharacterized protein n=1 Tax=candidate division WOR-3 bacterium TaxID=2052148 RepID=A0A9D5K894_UNCW3|nr:hypothetical protein [candidate division WOR-3 bacterium]MBD3364118.1 hypothetical protein [candidate division WOR-3 bacterium]